MDVKEMIKWLFSYQTKRSPQSSRRHLTIALSLVLLVNLTLCHASNQTNQTSEDLKSSTGLENSLTQERLLKFIENTSNYISDSMDEQAGTGMARTFGRPLRKLQSALLPVMFMLGVMSTLIFLTFLLTLKGVAIGGLLLIFKVAGFLSHFKSGWGDPHHDHHGYQKDIHLHISGHPVGHGSPSEHYPSSHEGWNRLDGNAIIPPFKKYSSYGYPEYPSQGLTSNQGLTSFKGLSPSQAIPSYQTLSHQASNSANIPYGLYVRNGDSASTSTS